MNSGLSGNVRSFRVRNEIMEMINVSNSTKNLPLPKDRIVLKHFFLIRMQLGDRVIEVIHTSPSSLGAFIH